MRPSRIAGLLEVDSSAFDLGNDLVGGPGRRVPLQDLAARQRLIDVT